VIDRLSDHLHGRGPRGSEVEESRCALELEEYMSLTRSQSETVTSLFPTLQRPVYITARPQSPPRPSIRDQDTSRNPSFKRFRQEAWYDASSRSDRVIRIGENRSSPFERSSKVGRTSSNDYNRCEPSRLLEFSKRNSHQRFSN
jgi:hypothetical protein